MKYLLSNGGGVNSNGLLIWLFHNELDLFKSMSIVFADTHGELPETYEAEKRLEAWLADRGQSVVWVSAGSLEKHSLKEQVNPMRHNKWCTDKFKIRPINEWADGFLGRPRVHILGIAADEALRAKPNPQADITNRYPLVEAGITRAECNNLIASEGFQPVPKSGCFFCPLARVSYFVGLQRAHPELYNRAVAMEKANGHPLKHKFLEDIVGLKNDQGELFEDMARECESGYCFT